jgi:hypothetical protein
LPLQLLQGCDQEKNPLYIYIYLMSFILANYVRKL